MPLMVTLMFCEFHLNLGGGGGEKIKSKTHNSYCWRPDGGNPYTCVSLWHWGNIFERFYGIGCTLRSRDVSLCVHGDSCSIVYGCQSGQ